MSSTSVVQHIWAANSVSVFVRVFHVGWQWLCRVSNSSSTGKGFVVKSTSYQWSDLEYVIYPRKRYRKTSIVYSQFMSQHGFQVIKSCHFLSHGEFLLKINYQACHIWFMSEPQRNFQKKYRFVGTKVLRYRNRHHWNIRCECYNQYHQWYSATRHCDSYNASRWGV